MTSPSGMTRCFRKPMNRSMVIVAARIDMARIGIMKMPPATARAKMSIDLLGFLALALPGASAPELAVGTGALLGPPSAAAEVLPD